GADTFRLYEMYMGPLEASKPWNTKDISGLFRFLQRTWRVFVDEATDETRLVADTNADLERQLHRTIAKVQGDIERLAFNTAIASLIGFVNAAVSAGGVTRSQGERFLKTLSPFAPHMAEELWKRLGKDGLAMLEPWPDYDETMLKDDTVEIPVQIMGKVRARLSVAADLDKKALEAAAFADPKVQELIAGKTVRKVIVVPGRLVNIVAN
ncbi:MAG: class I tRNA ligase family protein, partial [Myxococcales bacterium]|nr:class I tRNA ligase family protein [Myxococcales bacterium]